MFLRGRFGYGAEELDASSHSQVRLAPLFREGSFTARYGLTAAVVLLIRPVFGLQRGLIDIAGVETRQAHDTEDPQFVRLDIVICRASGVSGRNRVDPYFCSAMTINDRIVDDMKVALKSGERLRLETLRMVRAAILELQKSGKVVTPEMEMDAVVKQGKRRRDAADQYRSVGRDDLAEKEEAELSIIQEYLPKQLTDDEIRAELRLIIDETGACAMSDVKLVMPRAMGAMKGRADGGRVQALVRELLAGGAT